VTGHLSSLTLERHSVDDLVPAERQLAAAHLSECPDCRARLKDLADAKAALMARRPPAAFAAQIAARRPRPALWLPRLTWAGALCAAAVAAFFVLRPPPSLPLKGVGMTVHRLRAGRAQQMGDADTLRAGDGLRVELTLPRRAHVQAWFVDAHGTSASMGDGPLDLPAGESALPGSATVDAPCTDLWLVVALDAANRPDLRPGSGPWPPPGTAARLLRCE
jgi:hypothetical protein